jgi:hypothetical protein
MESHRSKSDIKVLPLKLKHLLLKESSNPVTIIWRFFSSNSKLTIGGRQFFEQEPTFPFREGG